jgi:hypothetical protein
MVFNPSLEIKEGSNILFHYNPGEICPTYYQQSPPTIVDSKDAFFLDHL